MGEVKTGTFYGVSVGPGDPELMTLKAVYCIRRCPVLAVPQTAGGGMLALAIARSAVELEGKTILPLRFAMSRDPAVLQAAHAAAADAVKAYLVVGVLRVALHLHQLAVLHVGQDAAHVVASRRAARGAADHGHAVLLPRPRHLRRLGGGHGRARVGLLRQARAAAVLLPVGLAPVLLHGCLG